MLALEFFFVLVCFVCFSLCSKGGVYGPDWSIPGSLHFLRPSLRVKGQPLEAPLPTPHTLSSFSLVFLDLPKSQI